jgi:hypothetical protein
MSRNPVALEKLSRYETAEIASRTSVELPFRKPSKATTHIVLRTPPDLVRVKQWKDFKTGEGALAASKAILREVPPQKRQPNRGQNI